MRTKVVVSVIVLLVVLLLAWWVQWFFANHEQKTREIKVDVSPLAKRNSLLAADYFLKRLGRKSESVSGRDYLLSPPIESGLLLVSRLGVSLPPERQQLLLDWVGEGGHLVISPDSNWDAEDAAGNALLEHLGVEIYRHAETDSLDDDASSAEKTEQQETLLPVVFEMPEFSGELAVAFTDHTVLYDSAGHAEWQVETDQGAHLLQFDIGQGKITVLSDSSLFSNDRIGEHDHALLLARLAGDQPQIWLLYSSEMPSLLQLLWRHATALMLSLGGLVLLLVWTMTERTGPILTLGHQPRRNLMEHLTAVGHYLWRTDQSAATFSNSQVTLEQTWLRRHPVLLAMQQAERCLWIASHVGMTPHAVERALYSELQGEQALIQVTAIQQKLVAQLDKQHGLSIQGGIERG